MIFVQCTFFHTTHPRVLVVIASLLPSFALKTRQGAPQRQPNRQLGKIILAKNNFALFIKNIKVYSFIYVAYIQYSTYL